MGCTAELKPPKPEKPSPPAKYWQDRGNLHAYPDWVMMQAYYGRLFTVPPYLNSAVASLHIPCPYMWLPQYMIPPYGASYPVLFAHEGVYGHPEVLMGGTIFNMDAPAESSGFTDGGSARKKLEDSQGLAISKGNRYLGGGERETNHRLSEREETVDSSDGSNGVSAEAGQSRVKRSRAESLKSAKHDKDLKRFRGFQSTREMYCPGNEMEGMRKFVLNVKPIATYDPNSLLQNEWELQHEKRKLSNRESARRSRLRKQVEAGELATNVEKLTTENMTLKSKIEKFMEMYKKLELENATLMEKLRNGKVKPVASTVQTNEDGDSYENRSRAAKLHLLVD